ncbi:MAG: hypothetical protein ACR2IV_19675 [Bryobacteraceae bacterium]
MPPPLNTDFYRCATSLRSELSIVETLLKLAKRSLCPKLKTYAQDLGERRLKLISELKIRTEEENISGNFGKTEATFGIARRF